MQHLYENLRLQMKIILQLTAVKSINVYGSMTCFYSLSPEYFIFRFDKGIKVLQGHIKLILIRVPAIDT